MSTLDLDKIRADERCQPRTTFDTDLVAQYAEAMANGDTFPPVKVFFDGVDHFLADGFHRYHAAASLGLADIAVDISEGTLRDAILYSCSANASHGWRRTNDDKRRAVLRLLNDPEWQRWSDREIARRCAVEAKMVGRLRPNHTVPEAQYEPRTFVHPKTGQETQMRTANIGARAVQDRPLSFERIPAAEDLPSPRQASAQGRENIESVNREAWAPGIWEITRLYRGLPAASDAGQRFPSLLLHTLDTEELIAISAWFASFSVEILNRKESADVPAK
ncbi:ParB N-terminal domain-containing protein [Blastomonas sp. CCH2-A2]|uniref:ParB N-terminal domain-containing protein n=1 Tax=Blastomonas sp. CCH2-A2 TaxID=1768788 RepID=UPI000824B902|nr:ParB N-terminal domain-containing protein [Blastomonas sp. CCH2-A2]